MKTRPLLIGSLLLVGTLGCGPRFHLRSDAELARHRAQFIADVAERRIALSRRSVERMVLEQDAHQAKDADAAEPTFDVLILSGGGDAGAFGAGVLKGWGAVTDGEFRRPQFDIVTGVSTGALIAPFAFIGTDQAYEEAYVAYREPKPTWFRVRNLFAILLLRRSFIDNKGLSDEISTRIDRNMLGKIAEEADQHRLLFIGTTNLELGMLTMWDATRIAHEVIHDRRDRSDFDQVILASTAIPAVFPPVILEGDHYVDGGVTRNIAYTTDQDAPYSTVNVWKREHSGRKMPKTRVWVIINNQLTTRTESTVPTWPSVTQRSLDISIRSATLNSLKALEVSMELLRLRDNAEVEFRFIAIPDEWRPPVRGPFKKETMSSLAELGCRLGADPASWRTKVPNPEYPEF